MSTQKEPTIIPPVTVLKPSISVLFTNIRLLQLDQNEDWPNIATRIIINEGNPHTQKIRISCVEWILFHLWQIWDPEECQNVSEKRPPFVNASCLEEQKLQPFFPPLEPLQSIKLRAALSRSIDELKKKKILGRDVITRRSMFEDCKGEILHNLLSAFSIVVLRKQMKIEAVGKSSIVGRLCTGKSHHSEDLASMLPLSIAHRSTLVALLRRKSTLKVRYRDFGIVLGGKDKELAGRLDKVVETQNFLDKNPPSEATVGRVKRIFDQHWQGNQRQAYIIEQGEEHGLTDLLLDQDFEESWRKVGNGTHNGEISTNRYGLLDDLEKRVATQRARLQQWKDYRRNLETRKQLREDKFTTSEVRAVFRSPQSHRYDQRKEKDLVFSPRKSPRKSMKPAESPIGITTVEDPDCSLTDSRTNRSVPSLAVLVFKEKASPPLAVKPTESSISANKDLRSSISFGGGENNSEFSEISVTGDDIPEKPNLGSLNGELIDTGNRTGSVNPMDSHDGKIFPQKPYEDGLIAEQLVSSTTDTGPLALESKLSATEKAGQPVAFIGLGRMETREEYSSPNSSPSMQPIPPLKAVRVGATLVERTRESISLVQAKPRSSRDSICARRTSKIYPANQFETPRRPQTLQKMTPPEELMSSGAGYDSVFKSRPKVAFSPTISPKPEYKNCESKEMEVDPPEISLGDSPSTRIASKGRASRSTGYDPPALYSRPN